jgi:hypothetical protein
MARALWLDGTFGWSTPAMSAPLAPPFSSSALVAASTGDLNGDGVADVLIGDVLARVGDRLRSGRVFIVLGAAPFELTLSRTIDRASAEQRPSALIVGGT